MRRKDRARDELFAHMVIDKSTYAVLSMVDELGLPYAVPISPARVGQMIYIHAALEGKKIDLIKLQPMVSLVFVGDVRLPHIAEIPETIGDDPAAAGKLLSQFFTNLYESAIVYGRAYFVETDDEKKAGLKAISEKYTPASMPYFSLAVEEGLHAACVIRIEITKITAKSNI